MLFDKTGVDGPTCLSGEDIDSVSKSAPKGNVKIAFSFALFA